MRPRMIVVAGPPGSGKSALYPVSGFGVSFFNADDRAAELNGGSYLAIPSTIRSQVNGEFEQFVRSSIERGESFAVETTLRSSITFDQAGLAMSSGFSTEMRYLALSSNRMAAKSPSWLPIHPHGFAKPSTWTDTPQISPTARSIKLLDTD